MSYTNPQQYIISDAQHYQRLQDTISRTTEKTINSIVNIQKQRKATLAAKGKELKRLQERSNDRVAKVNLDLAKTTQSNPSANLGETYKPLVDEYRALSDGVESSNELNYMGRTYNPAEARSRMTELEATISGVKGTIENLVSYTDNVDEYASKIGKAGGYYEGNEPNTLHSIQILRGNAPGTKKGVFEGYEKDGNLKGFAWEFFDGDGKSLGKMSEEQLANLNKNGSELMTIIPDQASAYEDIRTNVRSVYTEGEKNNKGEISKKGVGLQKTYLTAYNPEGEIIENNLIQEELKNYSDDPNESYTQAYSKVNKQALFKDVALDGELIGDANAILEGDLDTSSAMALHNTDFKNVNFKPEYFLNNPSILDDNGNEYNNEASLPEEIKIAIKGSKEREQGEKETDGTEGYLFPDDRALTNEEQNIFKVAYKANYIDTKIPDKQAVGVPQKSLIKEENKELTPNQQLIIKNTNDRLTTLKSGFEDLSLTGQKTPGSEGSYTIEFNAGLKDKIDQLGFTAGIIQKDSDYGQVMKVKGGGGEITLQSKGMTLTKLKQRLYLADGGKTSDAYYKSLVKKQSGRFNKFKVK